MILKIEDLKWEDKHGWRFIDNVDDLRTRSGFEKSPDGDGNSVIYNRIEILKDNIVYDTFVVSNEQVYLLNSEGKTLERIN
jgi:hypothetical protein